MTIKNKKKGRVLFQIRGKATYTDDGIEFDSGISWSKTRNIQAEDVLLSQVRSF